MTIKFSCILFLLILAFQANAQVDIQLDSLKTTKDSVTIDSVKVGPKNDSDIKSPVSYSAKDSMMFSVKTKMIYSYGEAKLGMDDMKLEAGFIKMNMDSNYLYAEPLTDEKGELSGEPLFVQGGEEYKIKTIKYNFKTKKGVITDVVTDQGGGYLHGAKTKIQPNKEVHISDGKFTTCDADHPHFYVQLTKAKVVPEEKIVSGPFYFVISDIHLYPIGLPFGYFPNQQNRSSGILLPTFTEEKRRGFGLEQGGYYFALSDYVDLTATGEYWSSGSWGVNLQSDYKKRYKYGGSFNITYREVIESEEELEDYSKNSMFWVKLNYSRDGKANPTTTFNTSLNFGSSKHRKFNSNDVNVNANNNASSSIAFTKSWPGTPFNFSANMSATQNLTTNIVNLDFPTIAFNMNKQFPFKRKVTSGAKRWYEQISVGFSSNIKNTVNIADSLLFTEQSIDEMRNGLQYKIPVSTSIKLLKHINLSPGFNYNGRVYTSYLKQQASYSGDFDITGTYADTISGLRHVYDFTFSAPLSTTLYGQVNFKKGWISAVRHVIKPSVSFSYKPDFGEDKWGFYEMDYLDSAKRFSKYANGIYGTAPPGKSGSIGFSLGNNFEMKTHSKDTAVKFKKIILLNSLNFNTSYNLAADSLNWAPITISANTKLLKQINVTYSGAIDLYAIDESTGLITPKTYIEEKGVLGHLTTSRITLGGSINQDTFKKKSKSEDGDKESKEQDAGLLNNNNQGLAKNNNENETKANTNEYSFSIPWNISINYGYSFSSAKWDTNMRKWETSSTQTVRLNGNLSLTKKWSINGSLNYDIEAKKLVQTRWTITRDLHCWQMSFNFVPFGTYQNYSFKINVKSSMFQGMEYKKQESYKDNFEF